MTPWPEFCNTNILYITRSYILTVHKKIIVTYAQFIYSTQQYICAIACVEGVSVCRYCFKVK